MTLLASRLVRSSALLLFMSLANVASAAYTAANVKGTYSFLGNAWSPPGYDESASMGVVSFDGVSAVTGSFVTVTSSGVQQLTILAGSTYTVNPNGSASMTTLLSNGATNQFSFVLNSLSRGIAQSAQIIQNQGAATLGSEFTGVANSMNLIGGAGVANLKGSYSLMLNRWSTGTQLADAGVITFSGTGTANISLMQQTLPGTFVSGTGSGTYSVNSDGTGTVTLTVTLGGVKQTLQLDLVLNSVVSGVARDIQLLDATSTIIDTLAGTAVHQ